MVFYFALRVARLVMLVLWWQLVGGFGGNWFRLWWSDCLGLVIDLVLWC